MNNKIENWKNLENQKECLAYQLSNMDNYLPSSYKEYGLLRFYELVKSYSRDIDFLYLQYCKHERKFKTFRSLANRLLQEILDNQRG